MDFFTGLILLTMVLMMLACFLASVPVLMLVHSMIRHNQESLVEAFTVHQEWTINAISQLADHHAAQQQAMLKAVFAEMRYLSGKIPAVTVTSVSSSQTPPRRQTTGSMPKLGLPEPDPILVTSHEHDEEK